MYPQSIQFVDDTDKRYFADINGDGTVSTFQKIPSDLPIDIVAFAQAIATARKTARGLSAEEKKRFIRSKNVIRRRTPPDSSPQQQEFYNEILSAESLSELLKIYFGEQYGNLSVLDIGSGFGEFPLALAAVKDELGIKHITASENAVALLEKVADDLERAGVPILDLDARNPRIEERYDIVTLNAPQAYGMNAYAREAIKAALLLTKEKGLILLRMNEMSDDIGYEPEDDVPKEYFIARVNTVFGLPQSMFTKRINGKSASVYIILKE